MAEETNDTSSDEGARPSWLDEAEKALERASESLRAAWEETRDVRMSALESAQQAAEQLGNAIDRGVEAARSQWEATGSEEPATEAGDDDEE